MKNALGFERMKRYRLYTELKNLDALTKLAQSYFEGFTMYAAKGVWKGQEEGTIIIEVMEKFGLQKAMDLAEDIKELNGQEAVFLTVEEIGGRLI